ncbi:MAG: hypothetical protein DRP87_15855 [Spirochaetes bacterium]|nr:MAG: hypothetical protein DRP87_15855 [Spirochaetota bacterium]
MISYKELKELLQKAIRWEEKLKDLYDVAELGLKEPKSKEVVKILGNKLKEKLEVSENVDVEKHGRTEWVRFAPDYRDEDLIPKKAITKHTTPEEIFRQLLDFETKLKSYYSAILKNLRTDRQRDLFESLVRFKEEQVAEIKRFKGNYNLVS